jgi:hypothetical protein
MCGPMLALFCEGLMGENYSDCEGAKLPALGDTTVRFGMMMSEPGSISSDRGSLTLRGTV